MKRPRWMRNHPEETCILEKYIKDTLERDFKSQRELKTECIHLFRTLYLCHCSELATRIMH